MRSFYTKLFMLTCIFGLPCMASLEQLVVNGRRFIQGHHEERRMAFNEDFRDQAIARHTKAIDDLLSDETRVRKVKMSTHELQNHQRTILSAVIAKELIGYTKTPRKARSIYKVKQSSAHFKHFEILRLTEDFSYHVAHQLYQDDSFNPERLKGLIIGNYAQILTYSGLTRDMFADWFVEVIGAHYEGIIEKKKPAPKRTMPVSNRFTPPANHHASAAAKAKIYDPESDDDDYVEQPIPPAKPIPFDPTVRLPEYEIDYSTAAYNNPYGSAAAAAYDPEFHGAGYYGVPPYSVEHNADMSEEEALAAALELSMAELSQNRVGTRTYRTEKPSAFNDEEGLRKADCSFTEQLFPNDDYNPYTSISPISTDEIEFPIIDGEYNPDKELLMALKLSKEQAEKERRRRQKEKEDEDQEIRQAMEQIRLEDLQYQEVEERLAVQRHQEEQRRLKEEEERLAAEQMITPISNPRTVSIKIGELLNTLDRAAEDIKKIDAAEMSVTINEHTWTVSVENYAEFKELLKGTYNPDLLIGPHFSCITKDKIKTRFSTYLFQKANGDIIELTLKLKK